MSTEIPIATCYLYQTDDERNRCWLTSQHLYVRSRGKTKRFDLERIQQLSVEYRRWWFPVVAGGILAPLSLLAILLNLYNPWWLISLLVGSMLLWYWGATQHAVLAIHQPHHRQDIPLLAVTPNLRAFLQFTNRFLRQGLQKLYVSADPAAWQEAQRSGVYRPAALRQQGFISAYSLDQVKKQKASTTLWLAIDPVKASIPIRYEAEGEQLSPRIYGPIPLSAITPMTNTKVG